MLALAGAASADDAKDTAAARAFGQEGVQLADQGKCPAAIEKIERAEKLHHAPTTAARLGECEIQVGKVIAGTERLQRLIREGLPPSPPKSFVAAMERAQKTLDAALPRIATLRISVKAPTGTKAVVVVDDETISSALIGADMPVDPGPHKISASAKGLVTDTKQLTLKDGETNGLTLTLIVDSNYKPEAAPVAVTPVPGPTGPTTPPPDRKTNVLPFVAFGVGAVGLGVGAVTGLIVGSKSSDLTKNCRSDGACPSSQDSTLSSANTLATVSTIGFIVGGAGVAAGVVLLLTQGATTTASSRRPGIQPLVGVGYAGLDGTF